MLGIVGTSSKNAVAEATILFTRNLSAR
jgi:hypothetical protein